VALTPPSFPIERVRTPRWSSTSIGWTAHCRDHRPGRGPLVEATKTAKLALVMDRMRAQG
jgi:hypothetical protein